MTKTEIKKRKKVAKLLAAGLPIPEDLQRFLLPPGEAFDPTLQADAEEAVEPLSEPAESTEEPGETSAATDADGPDVASTTSVADGSNEASTLTTVDELLEAAGVMPPAEETPGHVAETGEPPAVDESEASVSVPEDSTAEPVAPVAEAPAKRVRKTKKQLAEEAAALEAELVAAPVEPIVDIVEEPVANDVPEDAPAPAKKPRKGRLIIEVEVPETIAEPAPVEAVVVAPEPIVDIESAAPKAKKKAKKADTAPAVAPGAEPRDNDGPLFSDLGLPEQLLAAVKAAGFESPTPIQARAIPPLLAGHDLVGQAQTGTGKTAAFALPLLARIDPNEPGTQALVVVPTRELAIQAAEQIVRFGGGIRVVPVYGGQPIDRQFRALMKPPAVVVGTPGRLLDHLRRGSLNLGTVRFCALDEADEMLSFGFIDDIEAILAELPEIRQNALFSATMPPRIAALADKYLTKAVRIEIEAKQRTVETVRQFVYEVPPGRKREALARILDMEIPGPTIVFCRTRAETQDLADTLRLRGYDAEPLHGDMAQSERDRIMKKFREEQTDLLVATDVAARGLDISGVTHVVNFDLPWDVEQYIHRIGRTGRAGREGDAISIIEPKERRNLKRFEYQLGVRLEQRRLPSSADIAARRREVFSAKVRERLEEGGFDDQLEAVSELSESWDVADIAAAALHLLWEASGIAKSESVEDELAAEGERPEPGMARLFVSLGRMDRVRPAELIQVIRQETGLGPGAIGTIDIMDRCSFVEVPQEHADQVIQVLGSVPYRGRRPKCGYAKPKEHDSPGRRF